MASLVQQAREVRSSSGLLPNITLLLWLELQLTHHDCFCYQFSHKVAKARCAFALLLHWTCILESSAGILAALHFESVVVFRRVLSSLFRQLDVWTVLGHQRLS